VDEGDGGNAQIPFAEVYLAGIEEGGGEQLLDIAADVFVAEFGDGKEGDEGRAARGRDAVAGRKGEVSIGESTRDGEGRERDLGLEDLRCRSRAKGWQGRGCCRFAVDIVREGELGVDVFNRGLVVLERCCWWRLWGRRGGHAGWEVLGPANEGQKAFHWTASVGSHDGEGMLYGWEGLKG